MADEKDYRKLYEEAQRRLGEEQRLREEEQRLREQAQRRLGEEQRRREEEQRRREEEQQRREEEQRLREEEQRRREEEQQRREEEQRLREEQQKQIEQTDFHSYLSLCHHELFIKLVIQNDPALASAPGMTKVDGKYYPLRLEPWASFPSLHQRCFNHLEAVFGDGKHFLPRTVMEAIRGIIPDRPVADEQDMKEFEFLVVESCARKVWEKYLAIRRDQTPSTGDVDDSSNVLPDGIKFLNNPYGLLSVEYLEGRDDGWDGTADLPAWVPSMAAARVDEAEGRGRPPGDEPPPAKRISSPTRPKIYPDKWCLRVDGESHVPILVMEYKAAHKLRAEWIQKALAHTRDGDLFRDVVRELHNTRINQDEEARTLSAVKRATAQVLVQAFHYMIDFGLRYCYVTSGKALILLYLDARDPQTLYYHLAVPEEEVPTAEGADDVRRTAVALVSTMVLLALEAAPLTQEWKGNAQAKLRKWWDMYDEFQSGSEEDDSGGDGGPARGGLARRPAPSLPAPPSTGTCREPTRGSQRDDDDDDDDDDRDFTPPNARGTTAPPGMMRLTRSSSRRQGSDKTDAPRSGGAGAGTQHTTRPAGKVLARSPPARYCTQACLVGLRDGGPLDPYCPNICQHRQNSTSRTHAINRVAFVHLMRQQLAASLDEDCESLDRFGKFGAIGTLFRLTLRPFGYCVVAKGVQAPHAWRLEGEERVYEHLREQQGWLVPVCLGVLRLAREYWTSSGAHVSHMMLLSYCGEEVGKRGSDMPAGAQQEVERVWARLRRLGVEHGDERDPNVVWNADLQRAMCIDFDWARIKPWVERSPVTLKRKRPLPPAGVVDHVEARHSEEDAKH